MGARVGPKQANNEGVHVGIFRVKTDYHPHATVGRRAMAGLTTTR